MNDERRMHATGLATQHGLVTASQLHGARLCRARMIQGRVDAGRLERVHRGVYRSRRRRSRPFEQAALAACLACGGLVAASHRSRGQPVGARPARADVIDLTVTVPSAASPAPGRRSLHRSVDLARPTRRRTPAACPVTTPLRLLVDLGAVGADVRVVADALDDLVGRES